VAVAAAVVVGAINVLLRAVVVGTGSAVDSGDDLIDGTGCRCGVVGCVTVAVRDSGSPRNVGDVKSSDVDDLVLSAGGCCSSV